jgi:hypothetical protein
MIEKNSALIAKIHTEIDPADDQHRLHPRTELSSRLRCNTDPLIRLCSHVRRTAVPTRGAIANIFAHFVNDAEPVDQRRSGEREHLDNPEPPSPGKCAWCSKPEAAIAPTVQYGMLVGSNAWLHQACPTNWHEARRVKTVAVLAAMRVIKPTDWSDQ